MYVIAAECPTDLGRQHPAAVLHAAQETSVYWPFSAGTGPIILEARQAMDRDR
jgi:hypothetical protein